MSERTLNNAMTDDQAEQFGRQVHNRANPSNKQIDSQVGNLRKQADDAREAADKCVAFGLGVEERADSHPYGPDWSHGFAQATTDAAADIAMYAATSTIPTVDKSRLRAARSAARHLSPLSGIWTQRPAAGAQPPRSHHEW